MSDACLMQGNNFIHTNDTAGIRFRIANCLVDKRSKGDLKQTKVVRAIGVHKDLLEQTRILRSMAELTDTFRAVNFSDLLNNQEKSRSLHHDEIAEEKELDTVEHLKIKMSHNKSHNKSYEHKT